MAKGEMLACLFLTEPQAGSDAAAIKPERGATATAGC
jgi:alkylation response protein AidB-like acyl-CoA dehydrogenase